MMAEMMRNSDDASAAADAPEYSVAVDTRCVHHDVRKGGGVVTDAGDCEAASTIMATAGTSAAGAGGGQGLRARTHLWRGSPAERDAPCMLLE